MTSPAENLLVPERVIVPCRLIFWGIIVCAVGLYVGSFDIFNDFVGMLLIFWGVVRLSRIPIARLYQQLMWFPVIVAFCATIIAFYGAILVPLQPTWLPPPNATVFAMWFLCAFVSLVCMVLFCCCMQKYCEVMSWERALASWLFSAKMTSRGVLIPFMIFVIPMFVFFTSLEFFPKNPPPIQEWFKVIDNEHFQYTALQNDTVMHTAIVPISPDGVLRYTYTKRDPFPLMAHTSITASGLLLSKECSLSLSCCCLYCCSSFFSVRSFIFWFRCPERSMPHKNLARTQQNQSRKCSAAELANGTHPVRDVPLGRKRAFSLVGIP